jgi:hypothetical protein
MNRTFLFLLTFALLSQAQAGPKFTRQYLLDEYMAYTIPVPYAEGCTTFLFPAPIQALRAAKVSTDLGKKNAQAAFYLDYRPGNYFFSIRALSPEARDVLTVIYDRKAYNFVLQASPEPLFTVNFYRSNASSPLAGRSRQPVTPARLVQLLDLVKSHDLLKTHHPEAVMDIETARPRLIMKYDGFDCLIDEVYRFDREDTLFFRCILRNHTPEDIYYKPQDIAVRCQGRIYTQSLVDASGIMPAAFRAPGDGQATPTNTPFYFCVTGTPLGGRNNLSAENNWNVLIPRVELAGKAAIPPAKNS